MTRAGQHAFVSAFSASCPLPTALMMIWSFYYNLPETSLNNISSYVHRTLLCLCIIFGVSSPVFSQPDPMLVYPVSGYPNGLFLAEAYYLSGRQAMDSEDWVEAQAKMDEASNLIWRADLQAMPRGYIGEWRALRKDIEAALQKIGRQRTAVSMAFSEADSVYPEERAHETGFSLLIPILSKNNLHTGHEPPLPDFSRFDLPIVLNARVKQAIYILQNEAHFLYNAWLNRTSYIPMIKSMLSREGLPSDLIYVAMVESGFQPRGYSSDGAAGLWHLMWPDSEQYGLDRTEYIDERFDPTKSTRAVIHHFKALYREFGSWELVLAAHHAGAEPIRTAGAGNIWQMDLPRHTLSFVAFVMATAIISKSPVAYGFKTKAQLPLTYETVPVVQDCDLDSVALGMQVDLEQLKMLNPELRQWRASAGYTLKIPIGTQPQYHTWAGIEPAVREPSEITVYRVRRGDSILRIARRFGVRSDDIILENEILRPDRLRIGQVLYIPTYGTTKRISSTRSASSRTASVRPVAPPDPKTHTRLTYRIRRGDTLERIGRRYRVSIAEIQAWNTLRDPGDILAGQRLVIWIPTSKTSPPRQDTPVTDGATIVYTVRRGDTLWDIARQHQVTVSALLAANRLNRRAAIHPGDKLRITVRKSN